MATKLDKRRKYYCVLDCETATLPYAETFPAEQKKRIAIAKPLIYDIGWQIIDRAGNVYAQQHYLVTEIFSVPSIFNTAYYKNKRPVYLQMLANGEIELKEWKTVSKLLEEDMGACCAVGAYNSMFDYKKAIPFTDLYINKLYSPDYAQWEQQQNQFMHYIATHPTRSNPSSSFNPNVFTYHKVDYNLFDIWGLACEHLLNNDDYKQTCVDNNWTTASGKYFTTSAENAFRYLRNAIDFEESHTALDDAIIESEIFAEIVKLTKNKWAMGITYFPFRVLGTVAQFKATAIPPSPMAII